MAQAMWDTIAQAQRIQFYGVTGVGKTTAARNLARIIGAEAIDLDEIHWAPAHIAPWTDRPTAESYPLVERAVSADTFVVSGNYSKFRPAIDPRLDAAIFLDYPAPFALYRLLRRTLTRIITRERACNGNVESVRNLFSRDSIVVWWFRTFWKRRATMADRIADPLDVPILRMTSHADLEALFAYVAKQKGS